MSAVLRTPRVFHPAFHLWLRTDSDLANIAISGVCCHLVHHHATLVCAERAMCNGQTRSQRWVEGYNGRCRASSRSDLFLPSLVVISEKQGSLLRPCSVCLRRMLDLGCNRLLARPAICPYRRDEAKAPCVELSGKRPVQT
jgi:hypothetical protein